MQKGFILFILLISQTSFSQKRINEFNEQEMQFLRTLLQTTSYFKGHPTTPLAFHESETYSRREAFYDTVITKFFAKDKMMKLFEGDTSHLAVAGKLDWARHELNFLDYYLDIAPEDSILIEPARYFHEEKKIENQKNQDIYLNSLNIFFLIANKKVLILGVQFDKESNKILSLFLNVMTKGESEETVSFLKRQKNYYEFPDPKKKMTINQ